jgi:hypothetical protein
MPKRWSKLKKEIESLFEEGLKLDLHCIDVNRSIDSRNGNLCECLSMLSLGNYKVNFNKVTIWNFPKDFKEPNWEQWPEGNPWKYSVSEINVLVREYIDTPKEELLNKIFKDDLFGLTEILLAADRRLSVKRLKEHFQVNPSENAIKILNQRISNKGVHLTPKASG